MPMPTLAPVLSCAEDMLEGVEDTEAVGGAVEEGVEDTEAVGDAVEELLVDEAGKVMLKYWDSIFPFNR